MIHWRSLYIYTLTAVIWERFTGCWSFNVSKPAATIKLWMLKLYDMLLFMSKYLQVQESLVSDEMQLWKTLMSGAILGFNSNYLWVLNSYLPSTDCLKARGSSIDWSLFMETQLGSGSGSWSMSGLGPCPDRSGLFNSGLEHNTHTEVGVWIMMEQWWTLIWRRVIDRDPHLTFELWFGWWPKLWKMS